jgi:hypothetical protein
MSTLADSAKRMSDAINQKVKDLGFSEVSRYTMAFRLDDGTTDGTLYTSMKEAKKHQKGDYNHYAYINLRSAMAGMPEREAFAFLSYARMAYDAGMRLPDPESTWGDHAPVMPLTNEEWSQKVDQVLLASGYDLSRYLKD